MIEIESSVVAEIQEEEWVSPFLSYQMFLLLPGER